MDKKTQIHIKFNSQLFEEIARECEYLNVPKSSWLAMAAEKMLRDSKYERAYIANNAPEESPEPWRSTRKHINILIYNKKFDILHFCDRFHIIFTVDQLPNRYSKSIQVS